MVEALTKLIRVKTIVTLALTAVFAFLCCTGKIEAREFGNGIHRCNIVLFRNTA